MGTAITKRAAFILALMVMSQLPLAACQNFGAGNAGVAMGRLGINGDLAEQEGIEVVCIGASRCQEAGGHVSNKNDKFLDGDRNSASAFQGIQKESSAGKGSTARALSQKLAAFKTTRDVLMGSPNSKKKQQKKQKAKTKKVKTKNKVRIPHNFLNGLLPAVKDKIQAGGGA